MSEQSHELIRRINNGVNKCGVCSEGGGSWEPGLLCLVHKASV